MVKIMKILEKRRARRVIPRNELGNPFFSGSYEE